MTSKLLQQLAQTAESPTVERKQIVWDLASADGKANLVKHILALANCVLEEETAYLVFGVADARSGGEVLGLAEPLNGDQVGNVLREYAAPVPHIEIMNGPVNGKHIAAIAIRRTVSWPYYATRDVERVLSSQLVYARAGATIRVLKPVEFENWIRRKHATVGSLPEEPLTVSWIALGDWNGPTGPILRVSNASAEPVEEIHILFDIRFIADPAAIRRRATFSGVTLHPGEAKESEVDLRSIPIVKDGKTISVHDDQRYRWADVRARVRYRDKDGSWRSIECETSLV
jgi:hypothetical protein